MEMFYTLDYLPATGRFLGCKVTARPRTSSFRAPSPRLTLPMPRPKVGADMKPESPLKHFLLAFLFALIGYAVFYYAIEHRRNRNGPWTVAFASGPGDVPSLVINQPRLGITNVRVFFAGETLKGTNAPETLMFAQPREVPYPVPFGTCVFMDTTFLPGTVTFDIAGHEIELLPRVMMIDHEEHPWHNGETITLPPVRPPAAR